MIRNEKTRARVGSIFGATASAGLLFIVINSTLHEHRLALAGTLFVFWVGIYLALEWAELERKSELRRKFPTTSKELRERKKPFITGWPLGSGFFEDGNHATFDFPS